MTDISRARSPVDAPTAIAAASLLLAFNQMIVNIQPLLLGALADGYGLSDRQLGHVSAVFIGFTSIATLSAPWWVRCVNWRLFSFLAVSGAVIAMTLGMLISRLEGLLFLFAGLGLLKGFVGAPSFVCLGDTTNPDRNYGISVATQSLLSAAIAIPFAAYLIPTFGARGLFGAMALLFTLGLFAVRWLPRQGREAASPTVELPPLWTRRIIPALFALFALVLFVAGILGFWYFMERIGVARGVSPAMIGIALSSCSISTIVSAVIVAWLGGRFPSATFIILGSALIVAGYLLLSFDGDILYLLGANLFAFGWGLAQPCYWAQLRKCDDSGRLFVAAPAASGVAGVLIGIAAGPVIERHGYAGLMLLSSLLLILALTAILAARFLSERQNRPAGGIVPSGHAESSPA